MWGIKKENWSFKNKRKSGSYLISLAVVQAQTTRILLSDGPKNQQKAFLSSLYPSERNLHCPPFLCQLLAATCESHRHNVPVIFPAALQAPKTKPHLLGKNSHLVIRPCSYSLCRSRGLCQFRFLELVLGAVSVISGWNPISFMAVLCQRAVGLGLQRCVS